MASHDVFISYPSADKVAADGVCHGLEARGVRCWMAPRDVIPGSDWQTSLLDAISDARVVVLLFTENANNSEHIKREITAAFEGGAVVIPFRLENVMPKGALRYHLTGVHWLDAFSGEMAVHVEQLAETIKRVLVKPATGSNAEAAGAVLAAAAATGATISQPAGEPAPVSPPVPSTPPPTPAPPPQNAGPTAGPTPVAPSVGPTIRPFPPQPAGGGLPGVKPWMVFASVGGLALIAIIAVVASMMGGRGATAPTTPVPPASTSATGMQIDLNSRPTPGGGTPVPTLDPNVTPPQTDPQAPPQTPEQPPATEPTTGESPATYPDGTPMPPDEQAPAQETQQQ